MYIGQTERDKWILNIGHGSVNETQFATRVFYNILYSTKYFNYKVLIVF